jgi:hypothetical protein
MLIGDVTSGAGGVFFLRMFFLLPEPRKPFGSMPRQEERSLNW